MYKRILVTLDGSPLSEAVLPQVEQLDGASVRVTLLTVAEPPQATAAPPHPLVVAGAAAPGGTATVPPARTAETRDQAIQRARAELAAYLEEKAGPLRSKGIRVETEVRFGEAVEEILASSREHEVDLIIMATHGRSGLAQAVFGSVASRVLGSGVRPVLLVRPGSLSDHGPN